LSTTALDCCPLDTSSSKMACLHTQLVPCRTGSEPTAQISLPKTIGLQIYSAWTHWITMSGSNVGGLSQVPSETENDCWTEESPAGDLGQPTSRVIELSRSSQSDWRPVLQLRVDIFNIHSNCSVVTLLLLLERWYFTSWLLVHF